jgi:hypothetical protein
MFARNVSFHLKSYMLADYTRTFDKEFFRYFASRRALRTKLHSPVPAESMWLPSVCGTTKPVQKLTVLILTPKC